MESLAALRRVAEYAILAQCKILSNEILERVGRHYALRSGSIHAQLLNNREGFLDNLF